jgi:hypothetical protein
MISVTYFLIKEIKQCVNVWSFIFHVSDAFRCKVLDLLIQFKKTFLSSKSSINEIPTHILTWWLGYGLDNWGTVAQCPAGGRFLSLFQSMQNICGAHPASYSEGIGSPSLGLKWLECEADPSPPAKHELKNEQRYASTPPHAFTVHKGKTLQVHNFCNINSLFNMKSISLNYLHSDIKCCLEMHLI